MSYEMPDSFKPVNDSELSPDMQGAFRALFHEACYIYSINQDHAAVGAPSTLLTQHIEEQVSENPIFARAINTDMGMWSLLEVVCAKTAVCQTAIELLIKANPHALLWAHPDDPNGERTPIQLIANHGWNCSLLPWIVEHYPWVFQHQLCKTKPPHLKMVKCWVDELCCPETVREFYELYPQGLREKERRSSTGYKYPLSVSLEGTEEPEADLFIWMAKQYPEAVYNDHHPGYTMLHVVCDFLAAKPSHAGYVPFRCTANMANICRFLISEHPGLMRQRIQGGGYLPIHMLAKSCNRPLVQEMVVLLLKAYPECVRVKAGKYRPQLSSVPFIRAVRPLITKELKIDEKLSQSEPTDPKRNAYLREKQQIQERIADACRLHTEEDEFEECFDWDD